MFSYVAFLGHQPHLSIAELAATVPDFKQLDLLQKNILLFEGSKELNAEFMNLLGGTILIAQKIESAPLALEDIPQVLKNEVSKVKGKITFSLRCMGLSPRQVHLLYRRSKEMLKKNGRACRYIGTERKPAPAVLLHDSGILDGKHGVELTIIARSEQDLWVGRTVAAHDIDAYTKRDMKKPVRDTGVGLLPPKLAQTLLNFGAFLCEKPLVVEPTRGRKAAQKNFTVLDPFCGTGVIPLECLLRGWDVLASDTSIKAVNGTTKNIEWIRKEEKILKKDTDSKVWKQDALKEFDKKLQPDVIVTETTLGENFEKRPTLKETEKECHANEKLQMGFLENVSTCFPYASIACTWPVWISSKGEMRLNKVFEKAKELGYEAVLPPGFSAENGRMSLLYKRPEQFVGREIVLLKAKKSPAA